MSTKRYEVNYKRRDNGGWWVFVEVGDYKTANNYKHKLKKLGDKARVVEITITRRVISE